jgi:two-component system sensor histidine kinase TctE
VIAIGLRWRRHDEPPSRPSLRRRLLLFLLVPVVAILVLDAVLTYSVALIYANHVHDRDLANDAITLAQMLKQESSGGELSPQAHFLLEYDPDGREYFAVRSTRHGLVDGSRNLSPGSLDIQPGQSPELYDTRLDGTRLRAATIVIDDPRHAGDTLRVSIAENLRTRHQQAREILMLAVPLQILLIAAVLLLVWFGVNFGLRVLDPLTRRLADREHDLAPIDAADVPVELLPLTRTIDDLFARLRELIALHERFIADAAHQLRTPLAGLTLHVERALAQPHGNGLIDALTHVRQLTARVTRTSSQLLALTRAQSPAVEATRMVSLDLAGTLREVIEPRLHDAWRTGVDLGYEGPLAPVPVIGDVSALQELADNLIDNALRYARRGGAVTIGLRTSPGGGVCLSVEDDGPGVDDSLLSRLGERFFRGPDAVEGGTGLGLAIVRHIAERHDARVVYRRGRAGGLRVEVHFPALEQTA